MTFGRTMEPTKRAQRAPGLNPRLAHQQADARITKSHCGEAEMAKFPRERLAALREKIAQQRTTVEALKRNDHEHADAERQLRLMLEELRMIEGVPRSA